MSLRFARNFSQQTLGHIKKEGSNISVWVPQAIQQLELFTQLKQHGRKKALDKTLAAIMFNHLNAHNRDIVFKPTVNADSASAETNGTESVQIRIGDVDHNIKLTPKKYEGRPSKQDLRVIALTSKTPEQLVEAVNYLKECLKLPRSLGKNFDPVLTSMLLRRAANAGNFEEIYSFLLRSRHQFNDFLREGFNSEALRIYALRVPYLSVRSKSMLNLLYRRSTDGLGRELAYAYGLNAYAQKFGDAHKGHLLDTFKNIKKKMVPFEENPRRALMKSATLTDLVLGYEAVCNCSYPEAKELVEPLKYFLERTSRMRELTPSVVVNISEKADTLSEEQQQQNVHT